jgi:nucleoside 2-deoxyribosyltransferase
MECPVCFDAKAKELDSAGGVIEIECGRCGRFKYAGTAWEKLKRASQEKRAVVASWLWEQNRYGGSPKIDDANIEALLSARSLPFLEKAKRLLLHLAELSNVLGKPFDYGSPKLDAMLGTLVHNDIITINELLVERGWVTPVTGGLWRVTGAGFLQADEWRQSAGTSAQAFVAMWFDPSMEAVWEALKRGISAAGYRPLRIDNKEHANKICDEIISEIRRSRFLVADYTKQRGGVYYEAGFAAGRNLPVILTCQKDDLANLHFDVRQYNCIDWESPDELSNRLQVRIEAIIGDGPLKSS